MDWTKKYSNFKDFEKSPDYKKWLEKKLEDAPIVEVVNRQKTESQLELERRQVEIDRKKQEILQKREEARNDPNAIFTVTDVETGEQQIMTQKEYREYFSPEEIIEEEN